MGVGRSVCSWQLAESQSVHARARLSMISQARRLAGSQARRLAGSQARRLAGSQARRLAGGEACGGDLHRESATGCNAAG